MKPMITMTCRNTATYLAVAELSLELHAVGAREDAKAVKFALAELALVLGLQCHE